MLQVQPKKREKKRHTQPRLLLPSTLQYSSSPSPANQWLSPTWPSDDTEPPEVFPASRNTSKQEIISKYLLCSRAKSHLIQTEADVKKMLKTTSGQGITILVSNHHNNMYSLPMKQRKNQKLFQALYLPGTGIRVEEKKGPVFLKSKWQDLLKFKMCIILFMIIISNKALAKLRCIGRFTAASLIIHQRGLITVY